MMNNTATTKTGWVAGYAGARCTFVRVSFERNGDTWVAIRISCPTFEKVEFYCVVDGIEMYRGEFGQLAGVVPAVAMAGVSALAS